MSGPPAELLPVYAVVGADRFLRNQAIERLVRPVRENVDTVMYAEGTPADAAAVLDDVRSMSLLGMRRVVIVDDADQFISTHRELLQKYCTDPCSTGTLVLACKSLPKNTKLFKAINASKGIIACELPKGRAMVAWIVTRAREEHGKRITAPTAQRLRGHLDDSPGLFDGELAKLAAYVGDREEISMADIEALTGQHREEKVFAILDAIASGDTHEALRQWDQVLATDRAATGRAIGGLAWSVRRMLQMRRDWQDGADLGALARRIYTDPGVLRQRLERMTDQRLQAQQRDLLAADLAVKTGASTPESAIEKFIIKHGSARPVAGRAIGR